MARIEKISVTGYKSISNLEIDIDDINILIGSNGSGKSNFISVFKFLREITDGRLERYVKKSGGAEKFLHFGSKTTNAITFHVYLNESVDQYRISLSPTIDDELAPISETVYYWNKAYTQPYAQSISGGGVRQRSAETARRPLRRMLGQLCLVGACIISMTQVTRRH